MHVNVKEIESDRLFNQIGKVLVKTIFRAKMMIFQANGGKRFLRRKKKERKGGKCATGFPVLFVLST